jgi:chromate transporter
MKKTRDLFWTFLKIGAFTFGGGYAMVALLEREFVEDKQWMSREEFLDMVAIAESTPGPVAVNSATYVGYKIEGVEGAAASTLAVCLPSFVVIYLISLVFDRFLQLSAVASAFRGIQVCVIYLILSAGMKMLKSLSGTAFNRIIVAGVVAAMVGCSVAAVSFSSLYYILRGGRGAALPVKKAAEGGESMIYLQLFLNFLMIGALSFGGGYGMISLVRETVLRHGWLTEAEFLSFVAVSESTPGPLAINMATFIGSSQGGFPGALIATLGVVLPSFFIILLIAAVLKNLMKYAGVEAFLSGVRPCVVAMILATALNMMLSTLGGIKTLADGFAPDARSILVFAVLWAVHFVWKKRTQKAPSPIGMILLAAGLGILFWGV